MSTEGKTQENHASSDHSQWTDIMVDTETLGTAPSSVVFSVGAVPFNMLTGEVADRATSFSAVFPIVECEGRPLSVDAGTKKWWLQQTPEAQSKLAQAYLLDIAGVGESWGAMAAWFQLYPECRVWGNGAAFDLAKLHHNFHIRDISVPWKFWDERCFRTLRSLAPPNFARTPPTVAHDAYHDAVAQATDAIVIAGYLRRHGVQV